MNEKISNLRCLGGYISKDGKKVKSSLLFRSGNLTIDKNKLEEALNSRNINSVYDLRSSGELRRETYILPSHITYNHYPVLSSMEGLFKDINLNLTSAKEAIKLMEEEHFMMRIYKEMALYPMLFGEIIKDIIKLNGEPILFHCSAGKDRTGVLASLLLLSLGVSEEDVMHNYLLSLEYVQDYVEMEVERLRKRNISEDEINKIKDGLIVKEEYLNAFLDIIRQYPSFEDYAKEKLNLDINDLSRLRELFLE